MPKNLPNNDSTIFSFQQTDLMLRHIFYAQRWFHEKKQAVEGEKFSSKKNETDLLRNMSHRSICT